MYILFTLLLLLLVGETFCHRCARVCVQPRVHLGKLGLVYNTVPFYSGVFVSLLGQPKQATAKCAYGMAKCAYGGMTFVSKEWSGGGLSVAWGLRVCS